jgi:transglutaminase-like putative cysteine protease
MILCPELTVSIHVALNHVLTIATTALITLSPQVVRLRPAPHSRTPILSYSLKVTPAQHFINWQQDPQANYLARLVFPEKTREFCVEVDLIASMSVINPFDFFPEPYATTFPFKYEAWQQEELEPYLHCLPLTPLLRGFLDTIASTPQASVDFLVDLNRRCSAPSATSSALNPAYRRPRRRCNWHAARAAIRPGYWCNSCAISVWRRALSRAT